MYIACVFPRLFSLSDLVDTRLLPYGVRGARCSRACAWVQTPFALARTRETRNAFLTAASLALSPGATCLTMSLSLSTPSALKTTATSTSEISRPMIRTNTAPASASLATTWVVSAATVFSGLALRTDRTVSALPFASFFLATIGTLGAPRSCVTMTFSDPHVIK